MPEFPTFRNGDAFFTARSAAQFINDVYVCPGGVTGRYLIGAIDDGDLKATKRAEGARLVYEIAPADLFAFCQSEFPRAAERLAVLLMALAAPQSPEAAEPSEDRADAGALRGVAPGEPAAVSEPEPELPEPDEEPDDWKPLGDVSEEPRADTKGRRGRKR